MNLKYNFFRAKFWIFRHVPSLKIFRLEEFEFVRFVINNLDRETYLQTNHDVANAGLDPVFHWLYHGINEGRPISKHLTARIKKDKNDSFNGAHIFTWRKKTVVIEAQNAEKRVKALTPALHVDVARTRKPNSLNELDKFAKENFDVTYYLEKYADVADAKLDPLAHWLNYGLHEGRELSPVFHVIYGDAANRLDGRYWQKFHRRGTTIAFRKRRVSTAVISQILGQAKHDGAVVAPGVFAIPRIREFDGADLVSRAGVDYLSIFRAIDKRPEVIICTPFLVPGGAEKYIADLAGILANSAHKKVLVLVTDQKYSDAEGWEKFEILSPLKGLNVLHWPDICGAGCSNVNIFARLLNSLRPETLIINNSRIGLNAIAKYGRGLSSQSKVFCTYFSHGLHALGAPYGARFPHLTMRFSTALTDNKPMADTLTLMWGGLSNHGVAVLPALLTISSEKEFGKRLTSRQRRYLHTYRQKRWVWVGRVEKFKGTRLLSEIADRRPMDTFHIFGPIDGTLVSNGLDRKNILYEGVLNSVSSANFYDFDGFIFTSLFEGMPNTVLEMTQHAIPLILARVGGLNDTFSDDAVIFVDHEEDDVETAISFVREIERVVNMSSHEITRKINLAREQACVEHSREAFERSVVGIFDYSVHD